jgi:hypothetical protein
MFTVIATDTYLKRVSSWPKAYQESCEKLPKKLSASPLQGSPLGYPFLRESRIKEKRVYYLVYQDLKLVLLVAASGKKEQQATIEHIKEHLDKFKEIAQEIVKQFS